MPIAPAVAYDVDGLVFRDVCHDEVDFVERGAIFAEVDACAV